MFCYSMAAARKVIPRLERAQSGTEDVAAESLGVWWEVGVP